MPYTLSIDGGAYATFAAQGYANATLSHQSLAADELSWTAPVEDGLADLTPAYGDAVVLKDPGGDVVFRGILQEPRRTLRGQEIIQYRALNAWHALERLPYVQTWQAYNGTIVTDAVSPRIILGRKAGVTGWPTNDTERTTTAEDLAAIIAYAVSKSVPMALGTIDLPDRYIFPTTGVGVTVARLIQQILRWHDDAVTWWDYSTTTTLNIARRSTSLLVTLPGTGSPVSEHRLTRRPELVPSNVLVSYERTVEDGDGNQKLQIETDGYPDTTVGVGTLYLPIPDPGRPTPGQKHIQPVEVQVLPETGATDGACERWWLDHTGFGALGLDTGDIVIPGSDAVIAGIYRHQLTLVPNPDLDERPSTVNPNSTPIYSSDDLADFPNELINGQIADWMGKKARAIEARATIAVKASAIAALSDRSKAILRGYNPRPYTISSIPSFLFQCTCEVIGTNSQTQNYTQSVTLATDPAVNTYPGLARSIYKSRSVAPWEGTTDLLNGADLPPARYRGRTVRIEGRSDWEAARLLVQGETINLQTGQQTLRYGLPSGLAPQDFVELAQAARACQTALINAGNGPNDQTSGSPSSSRDGSGVHGTVWSPRRVVQIRTEPPLKPWDLKPSGTALVLEQGKIWHGNDLLSITDGTTSITPTAGQSVWLELDAADLGTLSAVTLKVAANWSGHPEPVAVTGTPPEQTYYRCLLWEFTSAEPTTGPYIQIGSVYCRKHGPDADLRTYSGLIRSGGYSTPITAIRAA